MRIEVPLLDFTLCLSDVMDLISPAVADHHRKTTYIAGRIGHAMGLPPETVERLMLAASVHDIGAFSDEGRLHDLEFDVDLTDHAMPGYLMLRDFAPFAELAPIVRLHHTVWSEGRVGDEHVPVESYIIHLADRIAVRLRNECEPVLHAREVADMVRAGSGSTFLPDAVDAFLTTLAEEDCFWLDLCPDNVHAPSRDVRPRTTTATVDLPDLSAMLSRIIDFRSVFTAGHSSGCAAVAEMLGRMAGMSSAECEALSCAGHVHDVGKVGVPSDLVHRPGPLTEPERTIFRAHAYYSGRVLSQARGLESIAEWAACHHERLDGSGYPFRKREEELDLATRILAVADVFAALREDRPYRRELSRRGVTAHLEAGVMRGAFDRTVVRMVTEDFDMLEEARSIAHEQRCEEYSRFRLECDAA